MDRKTGFAQEAAEIGKGQRDELVVVVLAVDDRAELAGAIGLRLRNGRIKVKARAAVAFAFDVNVRQARDDNVWRGKSPGSLRDLCAALGGKSFGGKRLGDLALKRGALLAGVDHR